MRYARKDFPVITVSMRATRFQEAPVMYLNKEAVRLFPAGTVDVTYDHTEVRIQAGTELNAGRFNIVANKAKNSAFIALTKMPELQQELGQYKLSQDGDGYLLEKLNE